MHNLNSGRGSYNTTWRAAGWEPVAWMFTAVITFLKYYVRLIALLRKLYIVANTYVIQVHGVQNIVFNYVTVLFIS
jgi:hypothetical protein